MLHYPNRFTILFTLDVNRFLWRDVKGYVNQIQEEIQKFKKEHPVQS